MRDCQFDKNFDLGYACNLSAEILKKNQKNSRDFLDLFKGHIDWIALSPVAVAKLFDS